MICRGVARVRRLRRDPGFPGSVHEGGRSSSPDRRVKRRLRDGVHAGAVARVRRLRRDPGFPGSVLEGGRLGSPDRRVKRRLRDAVEGFRSPLFRRKCLTVVRERVKGEKTVSPFTIPAVPQRNRCCALRSPPGPQPAVGSTRHHCLDSPLSAIPGGQPLSSVLRFADFSGHQGIAA